MTTSAPTSVAWWTHHRPSLEELAEPAAEPAADSRMEGRTGELSSLILDNLPNCKRPDPTAFLEQKNMQTGLECSLLSTLISDMKDASPLLSITNVAVS